MLPALADNINPEGSKVSNSKVECICFSLAYTSVFAKIQFEGLQAGS